MILDLLRNRETSRFFVAALLRMTLRQVSMATGGKGYPNFRRRSRRARSLNYNIYDALVAFVHFVVRRSFVEWRAHKES